MDARLRSDLYAHPRHWLGPVPDREIDRGIEVLSRRPLLHGGHQWTVADVQDTARLRRYRAVAEQHWILVNDGQADHRIPAQLNTGHPRDQPHRTAPASGIRRRVRALKSALFR